MDCKYAVSPGISTKLTSPLDIRLEAIIPLVKNPPWIINMNVEKLFGFNIGYLKTREGFAVMGYFNFRISLYSFL
jgi:hypothetical protein